MNEVGPTPVPVPPGRYAEYAAAIAEGVCPPCHRPFDRTVPMPGFVFAWCDGCGARWEMKNDARNIGWKAQVGEVSWEVWTNPSTGLI